MFSVFRNVTIPGTSHILLKVTWWEGGSCRRIVHHTHNQMYAAISAKRQVAGQHLCFIMLCECQWHKRPYQLSQWFLSKAQVNQSQAAACWSLLEGRAGADRFHPPYPCSLKKRKKKSPENLLNLEEDVDGLSWRKEKPIMCISTQVTDGNARKVNSLFHVSPTCAFSLCLFI